MTVRYIDPERCSEIIYPPGAYRGQQCSKKWKVTVKGENFCGQHDPNAVARRRKASDEKFSKQMAEQQRQWRLKAQERVVLIAAADWYRDLFTPAQAGMPICPSCEHVDCALARAVNDYLKI